MAASRSGVIGGGGAGWHPFALWPSLALVCGCSGPAPEAVTLYQGAPTDEALQQMLALPSQAGAVLSILSPVEGEALDANRPLTVTFSEETARLLPGPPATHRREAARRTDRAWLGQVIPALDLWFAAKAVHAHGTPYNGVAYLLDFTDHQGQLRLRVFTDRTTFTIPDPEWSILGKSPGPITLTIDSATFDQNDVVAGGGPFERAHVSFTID